MPTATNSILAHTIDQARRLQYGVRVNTGLVGQAGESLVTGKLLSYGANVAIPQLDQHRIDLLAFHRAFDGFRFVPVQVKTASHATLKFDRGLFTAGVALVWVWNVAATPRYFVFTEHCHVEQVLGSGAESQTWTSGRIYNVSRPLDRLSMLVEHEDRWDRILRPLGIGVELPCSSRA